MMWGFLFFVTYYFFFIIIASGFGVPQMENSSVYVVYCWIMDFVAPFVLIGSFMGDYPPVFLPSYPAGRTADMGIFNYPDHRTFTPDHAYRQDSYPDRGRRSASRSGYAQSAISNAWRIFREYEYRSLAYFLVLAHWAFVLVVLAIHSIHPVFPHVRGGN